ncbi:MAG: Ltp family lipoprotein [Alkalibacterium sp.]|nr:Ltp family lipoprotein [Alkalibacterium sp.]
MRSITSPPTGTPRLSNRLKTTVVTREFTDSEIYDQLIFEGFTPEQTQYAVDNVG